MPVFSGLLKSHFRRWVDAYLLAFLTLTVIVITVLYISQEKNFHWWVDWYSRTVRLENTWRENPAIAIDLLQRSLAEERNLLYAVPLLPFLWILGENRLAYEIGLALVYFLPFVLAMGAFAAETIPAPRQMVFWGTVLLTVLLPVGWITTFMGIPDTGGALFITLAAWAYVRDVRLKRWWSLPAMGLAIAIAVLLRRHFIYGGLTVLVAAALQGLLFFAAEVRRSPRSAWRDLLLYSCRIACIGGISGATVAVVAWQFTYSALVNDYKALYVSWSLPFADISSFYAALYGGLFWLVVAIGFSAAMLTRAVLLPKIRFVGLCALVSLWIWLVVLRYGNVFYSLHVTPWLLIGVVAFVWTLWSRLPNKTSKPILVALGCYLVVNFVMGLTPLGATPTSAVRSLFALNSPPLARPDYPEVMRLMNYLRQRAGREPVYVVGNQRLQITSSMVKMAEWMDYGQNKSILNILRVPQVDSRDFYPLEPLLQASYVVVPDPLSRYPGALTEATVVGEWLPDQEHDVVTVVADAFNQGWAIAQDFHLLPEQFVLEHGEVVRIYERSRPTSLTTALQTLAMMQQRIEPYPGGQPDWMLLSSRLNAGWITPNPDQTYNVRAEMSDRPPNSAPPLLYLGTLANTITVTGKMQFFHPQCPDLRLRVSAVNSTGMVLQTAETVVTTNDAPDFSLSLSNPQADYLLLETFSRDPNAPNLFCSLQINQLAVSPPAQIQIPSANTLPSNA